jgi:hypothetical protein
MDGLAHAWPQLVVLAEVPAAMLLFSGAIGVCAALQQWWLAVGATLGITPYCVGCKPWKPESRRRPGDRRNDRTDAVWLHFGTAFSVGAG